MEEEKQTMVIKKIEIDVDKMIDDYYFGRTVESIASEQGVSASAVRLYLARNNVEIRKKGNNAKPARLHTYWMTPLETLAAAGLRAGLIESEIAFRMGYTNPKAAVRHAEIAREKIRAREQADPMNQGGY
jgi:predicted transcriptional regulator